MQVGLKEHGVRGEKGWWQMIKTYAVKATVARVRRRAARPMNGDYSVVDLGAKG